MFCRPLLGFAKAALIDFCHDAGVQYIEDPSNHSEKYARVRLRNSMDVLADEGLTAKRLSMTARRLYRARQALDRIAREEYDGCSVEVNSKRIVFNLKSLTDLPEEIILRVVMRALKALGPDTVYGPRFEKVEQICEDLMKPESFRKRTLGGIIFERCNVRNEIVLSLEKPA